MTSLAGAGFSEVESANNRMLETRLFSSEVIKAAKMEELYRRAYKILYDNRDFLLAVQKELLEHYPPTTPVAACYKLTWKDERIYRGELKDLEQIVKENNLTLTTLLVVGDAIDNRTGVSRLYAEEFKHLYRR